METNTDTFESGSSRVAEEPPVPTVIAKKRPPGDAPGTPAKADQNAAEIERLSKWATGDCGGPILPD